MINCGRLVNQKGPGFRTQSSKSQKLFPIYFEILSMTISFGSL